MRLGSLVVLGHRWEPCREQVAAGSVAVERGRVEQNVWKRIALERVVLHVEYAKLGPVG